MATKKLKLRPSVKAKWLAALRSGDYKQTAGTLRDEDKPNSFCCLGVLCNIHAQEHPKFAKEQTDIKTYDGEQDTPSERVLEWAFGANYNSSMDSCVLVKTSVGSNATLAELNDSGRYTFKAIANVIEKQL